MVRRTMAVGLLGTLVFVTACAQEAADNPLVVTNADGSDQSTSDQQPETPGTLDEVVEAAISDIEAFWDDTYPAVYGAPLEPIQGGYHPYGPDTALPECGGQVPDYRDIAENAFYCPESDLIAWDQERLFPELERQFGPFTLGLVMAHEFAHAVQARAGFLGLHDTIATELQADCYAGAWTGSVAEGNSDSFEIDEDKLDSSVAGMIAISDVPGTGANDPRAHGSGFDRIGSFQEGFQQGAERCSEYPDLYEANQLPIVQIPFQSPEDAARGGDLHLEDQGPDNPGVYSLAIDSLDRFYAMLFDDLGAQWTPVSELVLVDPGRHSVTCGGDELSGPELDFVSLYCEDENIVVMDEAGLVPRLYEHGDFAVGSELGRLWAIAAQIQLDAFEDGAVDSSLQADCLTGVWASALFPDAQGQTELGDVVLSPGDLDEAIMGFLTSGDTASDQLGTAFDRTSALRAGFVGGADACEEFGPLS